MIIWELGAHIRFSSVPHCNWYYNSSDGKRGDSLQYPSATYYFPSGSCKGRSEGRGGAILAREVLDDGASN